MARGLLYINTLIKTVKDEIDWRGGELEGWMLCREGNAYGGHVQGVRGCATFTRPVNFLSFIFTGPRQPAAPLFCSSFFCSLDQ